MEWYRYNDKDFNGEIKHPAQTTSSFYCKYLRGFWRKVSCDARLAQSSDFREFIWVAHLLSCLAFKTLVCITISHIQEERSSSSYTNFSHTRLRSTSVRSCGKYPGLVTALHNAVKMKSNALLLITRLSVNARFWLVSRNNPRSLIQYIIAQTLFL